MPGAEVYDYPRLKYIINRLANWFIRLLFRHRYNDTTNAFKAYRREVIETIQPLLSKHFNLTVEMPLKAIVRGHSYEVVPTNWTNRTGGEAKLTMKEMGSRYLFIVLYVWLEATLSRGDYRRGKPESRQRAAARAAGVVRLAQARVAHRGAGWGCRRGRPRRTPRQRSTEAVELPFLDLGGAAGGLEVEEDQVGVVDDRAARSTCSLEAVVDVVEVDRELAASARPARSNTSRRVIRQAPVTARQLRAISTAFM